MSDKWTFRKLGADEDTAITAYWVDTTTGTPIADVRNLGKAEALKNARLIAAAPELYKALAHFVDCLLEKSLSVDREVLRGIFHEADAALKLADSGVPDER